MSSSPQQRPSAMRRAGHLIHWLFADAFWILVPVLAIAVGGTLLVQGLLIYMGSQFKATYISIPAASNEMLALASRHTQVVLGVWVVTFLAPLLGYAAAVGTILKLPKACNPDHLLWRSSVFIFAFTILNALGKPLSAILAEGVFDATVGAQFTNGVARMETVVTLANFTHTGAAFAILFAVVGLTRSFQAALPPPPEQGETRPKISIQVVVQFIARLRFMCIVAALVLSSGVAQMVSWRFWPASMLSAGNERKAFLSLIEGSVILHATVFSGVMFALFTWPVLVLIRAVEDNPSWKRGLAKSGSFKKVVEQLNAIALALAPLATGIAAILLSGEWKTSR